MDFFPYKVGTARYMAPEVLDGAIQFTRDAFLRIDVYALGLVIWELMTRAHKRGDPLPEEGQPPCLPPYMAPFEAEVGPTPTMEKLQHYVAKLRNRPYPRSWWENDQVSSLVVGTANHFLMCFVTNLSGVFYFYFTLLLLLNILVKCVKLHVADF